MFLLLVVRRLSPQAFVCLIGKTPKSKKCPFLFKCAGERFYLQIKTRGVEVGAGTREVVFQRVHPHDWGRETGRGFYELGDVHGAVYTNFLMFGYGVPSTKDIPDGSVFSLKVGALTTNDVWYAEIGAEGINTNNLEVYTK